jgi:hypothetical protein
MFCPLLIKAVNIIQLKVIMHFTPQYYDKTPIAVAARSKAWVCGRSLAGIADLNPSGDMNGCLLCAVYCQIEVLALG